MSSTKLSKIWENYVDLDPHPDRDFIEKVQKKKLTLYTNLGGRSRARRIEKKYFNEF